MHITTPINVTDRAAGTTSDPLHLVKRQAVGSLSFESFAIQARRHDDLRRRAGAKRRQRRRRRSTSSCPRFQFQGGGPITRSRRSRRWCRARSSGCASPRRARRTGARAPKPATARGSAVNLAGANVVDANDNIILRNAQALQKFTGYYRPEDMDIDPIAAENGVFRACWANTGRMSHTDSSLVENSGVESEDHVPGRESAERRRARAADRAPSRRSSASSPAARNAACSTTSRSSRTPAISSSSKTDSVNSVKSLNPLRTELRGNDLWICLPDGDDDDALTDGCVRFASIRDTSAEPTGFIFLGSGEEAFVNIQHRAVNDAATEPSARWSRSPASRSGRITAIATVTRTGARNRLNGSAGVSRDGDTQVCVKRIRDSGFGIRGSPMRFVASAFRRKEGFA